MACPKCNGERIVKAGIYITKLFHLRQRYKCKDCKRLFVIGNYTGINVTLEQERQIIRLSKKINPYQSRYDHRKSKTYSLREISKIMKLPFNIISKILNKRKRKFSDDKYTNTHSR